MATIGQALTTPESGWRRYDDTHSLITYNGDWGIDTNEGYYGRAYHASKTIDNTINFSFYGTKLRIIADYYTNKPTSVSITIDGIEETYNQYSESAIQQAIVYEKTGLEKKLHTIIIKVKQDTVWTTLDAIDIDEDGELRLPYRKAIIKSPSTNQHYSLAEKTLIPLADASPQTIINYGIEAGKEIKLDEAFNKIKAIATPTSITEGNIFSVKFNPKKVKKIHEE